jgi:hypothetical protein
MVFYLRYLLADTFYLHSDIIRKAISELDGMRPLVDLLQDHHVDVKCLAAETIANCAKYGMHVVLYSTRNEHIGLF